MRKQKRQTVKKLMQCAAIIAAGVLAIILFMLAIWYRGKNSEPVTDEQVAAQMQQAEPLVIETPEAAAEGSIRVYDYDGCCIYAYYGKIRINNDGKDGKDIDVEAIGYLEGYATTFNAPYLLYEFEDGTKIYERIDAHALDSADMSDVIMQYDHEGRVFARQSNNTLILEPDVKGLFVAADLSRTDLARGLYQDISAGMITKMSWAFTVAEESYDRETHTRTILKIKKVYDVSAVSIPANNDTEISARAFASRSYERERQELLKRRAAILKIKASL